MPEIVTQKNIITEYQHLREAFRNGFLKPKEVVDNPGSSETSIVVAEATHDTLLASAASVANAAKLEQNNEANNEITKALSLISKHIPEEVLPKVVTLLAALEAVDKNTAYHSARVCIYSTQIGEACGLINEEISALAVGSLLHDIGKVRFPSYLFLNTGSLSPLDLDIVRLHPEQGEEILKLFGFEQINGVATPVRSHHEKLDGTGYPDGLKGIRIPLLAMIVKVADALDVMTQGRPYQDKMPVDIVMQQLHDKRKSEFEPELVNILEKELVRLLRGEGFKP